MVETLTSDAKEIDDFSQFRINRTDKIKNYFIKKIREREIISKKS